MWALIPITSLLVWAVVFSLPAHAGLKEALEAKYWRQIDAWVSHPDTNKIQEDVVRPCGKLTLLLAGPAMAAKFITTDREGFDFRVDVCVKATAHRVSPQPEFENPEITKIICEADNNLFQKLCERANIK